MSIHEFHKVQRMPTDKTSVRSTSKCCSYMQERINWKIQP